MYDPIMRVLTVLEILQARDFVTGAELAERLEVIHYAVSLGHHRSLVFYLATEDMLRTSFALGPEAEASYRSFAGDGIFRFSAGLEDPRDLCEDLDRALAAIP